MIPEAPIAKPRMYTEPSTANAPQHAPAASDVSAVEAVADPLGAAIAPVAPKYRLRPVPFFFHSLDTTI
jgi:hypothetical protein